MRSPLCYLFCVYDAQAQCGCWEGCWQWQRSRTLGNGVCTSWKCIILTDASPLGHCGGGSVHSLSLPPRGRAWSTSAQTDSDCDRLHTLQSLTVMRGQKEDRGTHNHTHTFYTVHYILQTQLQEGCSHIHVQKLAFPLVKTLWWPKFIPQMPTLSLKGVSSPKLHKNTLISSGYRASRIILTVGNLTYCFSVTT